MRISKAFSFFSIAIFLTGILVRCVVFFQNRSLFIDEANLARNFVEKSYSEFFSPLSYYQYSPPLFSFIEKAQIQLWGVHEYALRLFPLLCGIGTIYLFYLLCERLIDNIYLRWFPLWLVAFSGWFIRYATEVKQYSSDIFLGVLLPYLALRGRALPHWAWGIIGILSVWVSMSSVFFLAGIGLWFLVKNFFITSNQISKKKLPDHYSQNNLLAFIKHSKSTRYWILIILVWLVNFSIYYFYVLRPNVTSSDLQSYHNNYFLPLIPTTIADFILIKNLLLSIIKTGFGFTIPAYLIGIGGLIIFSYLTIKKSLFCFYKDEKAATDFIATNLLFGIPILLCLLASTLYFYSLIPRLTLFFIPALILLSTIGWNHFANTVNRFGRAILLIFLIVTASLQTGFRYLWQALEIEEIKPLLHVLKENKQADDYLYVFHEAEGPYQFYSTQHIDNQYFKFKNQYIAKWDENPDHLIYTKKPQRVWLLYSHLLSAASNVQVEKDLKSIEKVGNIELIEETQGGKLFLYIKNPTAQD